MWFVILRHGLHWVTNHICFVILSHTLYESQTVHISLYCATVHMSHELYMVRDIEPLSTWVTDYTSFKPCMVRDSYSPWLNIQFVTHMLASLNVIKKSHKGDGTTFCSHTDDQKCLSRTIYGSWVYQDPTAYPVLIAVCWSVSEVLIFEYRRQYFKIMSLWGVTDPPTCPPKYLQYIV